MSKDAFKIWLGNWLYRNAYPVYKFTYFRFKKSRDAQEIGLIRRFIKPGMNVYDIGANIGFYSIIFSDVVGPAGHVHCFEPESVNFDRLKNNVKGRANITANNLAVSDNDGSITVYKSPDLNVDHRTYKPEAYTSAVEIQAVSLDSYVSRLAPHRQKVDFIKMDIQGYEMTAMKGMEKVLDTNPAAGMLSEFWPHGLSLAGSSCMAFYETLVRKGRKVWLIENGELTILDAEKVRSMEGLHKDIFFNIYAASSLDA
jgi:FkbM family methyltransferase